MNKVIGVLSGGLGNQLFILNAVLFCASRNDLTPFVSDMEYDGSTKNIRNLEIQGILNELDIHINNNYSFPTIVEKSPFVYDARIEKISTSHIIKGYFQSYRYFTEASNVIKDCLLNKFSESIRPEKNFINLHFRRGDYFYDRKTQMYHGLLSDKYFVDSVKILRSIYGNIPVRIFSDSIDIASELLPLIADSTIVEDYNWSSLKTMVELSNCKALIASNSSLSWWSAFIGSHGYGSVIFPKRWVRAKTNHEEVLFPDWIKIDDPSYYEI